MDTCIDALGIATLFVSMIACNAKQAPKRIKGQTFFFSMSERTNPNYQNIITELSAKLRPFTKYE